MRTENFDDFNPRNFNPADFQLGTLTPEVPSRQNSKKSIQRTDADRTAAAYACLQLRLIGEALASKYDLSKATAKIISKGTKGFVAHRFTGVSGEPKVGGAQFAGEFKLDRYISYRIRDDVFALSAIATKDDAPGVVRFQVFAPKSLLKKEWQSFEALRPTLRSDLIPKLKVGGREHADIFSAWQELDELLSKSAVKRITHASLI